MDEPSGERRYGRAVFLGTVLTGVSSLVWGRPLWSRISHAAGPIESYVPLVPTGGWRIYTVASTMPGFDQGTWRLRVGGRVDRPVELTYDELRALPGTDEVRDFHCVTGWTVHGVHWRGVRVRDLLEHVGASRQAGGVRFVSAETPYVDSLTMRQAMLPDVLLAWEMDGRPLPREHGAPLRLVMPEMYGYKNVKWVERVDVVDHVDNGYWENLGYDRDAWVGRSNGYSS